MTPEIIITIITASITLITNLIAIFTSQSKTMYRIEQLEDKVKTHNNLIDRMYKVEKDIEVIETKLE